MKDVHFTVGRPAEAPGGVRRTTLRGRFRGGPGVPVAHLLGIFLIFWLLIIRPAQRRQKKLHGVQRELAVGDRVITGAGFFGTVVRVEDDRLGLEIAEGVVMTVARQAVVGTVDDDLARHAPTVAPRAVRPRGIRPRGHHHGGPRGAQHAQGAVDRWQRSRPVRAAH